MENNEALQKAGKAKIRLLAFFVCGVAVLGGVWEYQRKTAALDFATVVILEGENETKQAFQEINAEPKSVLMEENKEALSAFLAYFDELRGKTEEIERRESALDKIRAAEIPTISGQGNEGEIFKEGVIEIYENGEDVKQEIIEIKTEDNGEEPQTGDVGTEVLGESGINDENTVNEEEKTEPVSDLREQNSVSEAEKADNVAQDSGEGSTGEGDSESFDGEDVNVSSGADETENDGAVDLMKDSATRVNEER